jgi:hypothetical protein
VVWETFNRSFVRVAEATRGRHGFHDIEEMEVLFVSGCEYKDPIYTAPENFKLVPDGTNA